MRIYLDTNVHSFIARAGEAEDIRRFFDAAGHAVLASALHLEEVWAIPDPAKRTQEVEALTTVATRYEKWPLSYLHGQELLDELRRRRPESLIPKPTPDALRHIGVLLASHRELWRLAKTQPDYLLERYPIFRTDAEGGIKRANRAHKELRKLLRERANPRIFAASHPKLEELTTGFGDAPEQFWRVECMLVWHNALVARYPASRDYFDWVGPYVRTESFEGPAYLRFWLEEVRADRMRRNRLTSLASYYQLRVRGGIPHGNQADTLHANHLLDTDVFLTADQAFCEVLRSVRGHLGRAARVGFVTQTHASSLRAVQDALIDASSA